MGSNSLKFLTQTKGLLIHVIIWGLKTLVGKILNHSTFTHTDLGSIFVAKILRSTFTQYASPFIPDITGVIDGGVVVLIDPRLLT